VSVWEQCEKSLRESSIEGVMGDKFLEAFLEHWKVLGVEAKRSSNNVGGKAQDPAHCLDGIRWEILGKQLRI